MSNSLLKKMPSKLVRPRVCGVCGKGGLQASRRVMRPNTAGRRVWVCQNAACRAERI